MHTTPRFEKVLALAPPSTQVGFASHSAEEGEGGADRGATAAGVAAAESTTGKDTARAQLPLESDMEEAQGGPLTPERRGVNSNSNDVTDEVKKHKIYTIVTVDALHPYDNI